MNKFNVENVKKDIDTWTLKKKFYPKELEIDIEKKIIEANKFYIVHIDNEKKLFCRDARTLNNILYLNENFSRYIRNTCTTMINNGKIIDCIPSLDNKKFASERNELINYLFKTNKIEYVSGNISDVSNYIAKGGKK